MALLAAAVAAEIDGAFEEADGPVAGTASLRTDDGAPVAAVAAFVPMVARLLAADGVAVAMLL